MIENSLVETVVAEAKSAFNKNADYFSKTRDVFTARLQSYTLKSRKYLEAAIIGEIGNNTFDHNFEFNMDYPRGVYCNTEYNQLYVVLADYGRGVKQSLLAVLPSISSDKNALEIAFTKRISGRSPEQRGNGLKFVSDSIQQNNWHLYFQSGSGACSIDKSGIEFYAKPFSILGCLAIISFSGDL